MNGRSSPRPLKTRTTTQKSGANQSKSRTEKHSEKRTQTQARRTLTLTRQVAEQPTIRILVVRLVLNARKSVRALEAMLQCTLRVNSNSMIKLMKILNALGTHLKTVKTEQSQTITDRLSPLNTHFGGQTHTVY